MTDVRNLACCGYSHFAEYLPRTPAARLERWHCAEAVVVTLPPLVVSIVSAYWLSMSGEATVSDGMCQMHAAAAMLTFANLTKQADD